MEEPPWWAYSIMSLFFFVGLIVLNFIVNKINATRIEERFAKMAKTGPKQSPDQKLEIPTTEGNQYHTPSQGPDRFKTTDTRASQNSKNPITEGNQYQTESHDPERFKTIDARPSVTDVSKPRETHQCQNIGDVSKLREALQCQTLADVSSSRETYQCQILPDIIRPSETTQYQTIDGEQIDVTEVNVEESRRISIIGRNGTNVESTEFKTDNIEKK